MFRHIAMGLSAGLFFSSLAQGAELTIERLYSSPAIAGDPIRELKISPDGKRATFLRGKKNDRERTDLWQMNLSTREVSRLVDADSLHTGDEALSDEERARRERMRLHGSGIVDYQWSGDGSALLFPLAGDAFILNIGDKQPIRVLNTKSFETDIRFSPGNRYISFIRDQNLWFSDLEKKREVQVTRDGGDTIKNGMAEFVAQEEMGRMTGYWWSPDERYLAFIRVDESPVAQTQRSEIYADRIELITQRYPYAGTANVALRLGLYDLKRRKTSWVDLGDEQDFYLPRVDWLPDSRHLAYQWQSRDQQTLELRRYSLESKKTQVLLKETSESWVPLHDDLFFLGNRSEFIWASERDGFHHLYHYHNDGRLIRQLTKGEWPVDALQYVDEENGQIFYTAYLPTPLQKNLFSLRLSDGEVKRISQAPGHHQIEFAENSATYIDTHSRSDTPPAVSVHDRSGNRLAWLNQNAIAPGHPMHPYRENWITPEFGTLEDESHPVFHYRLYKPANFSPTLRYPAIVFVYGGPGVQLVADKWSKRDLLLQYMAQRGYAVFTLDNRGTANRGRDFAAALYKKMGSVEVEDQLRGVEFLKSLPWIDAKRIGIHGHSYGGYMTLMAMFQAPEVFAAGVAGAPVTRWELYDTHYTERYMGNPQKVPEAYNLSSVMHHAKTLPGALLIYHGMADDNVLFTHSTELYKHLQDRNLVFYSVDYPGKKHSLRGAQTEQHRANTIVDFFDIHLRGCRRDTCASQNRKPYAR